MITKENFKEVVTKIYDEILEELEKPGDYVSLWLYVFNSGWTAEIKVGDYDEEKEILHNDFGMLYCDKSEFIRLLEENKFDVSGL